MKTTSTTKKIAKVIVYFDDGTFEEVMSNTRVVLPQTPYVPYTPYAPPWISPFTVTCAARGGEFSVDTMSAKPTYSWSMGYMDTLASTSDGAPITNKYTITSTGNGHVELQG